MLNCQKKIKRSLQKLFLEITKPKLALYLVQIMLAFEISDVFSYLLDVLPLVAWNHIVRSVSLVRSDEVRIVNGASWLQRLHVWAQLNLSRNSDHFHSKIKFKSVADTRFPKGEDFSKMRAQAYYFGHFSP